MKIRVSGLKQVQNGFVNKSKRLKNMVKEIEDVATATPLSGNEIKKVIVAHDDKTALLEAIIRNENVDQAISLLESQHHMSKANIEAEMAKIMKDRRRKEILEEKRKQIKGKINKGIK